MSKKRLTEVDNFEEYQMVAIVSHLKDYTLCYHINLNLDFDLVKYNDLVIISPQGDENSFTWYYFKDEISRTIYYLIGNKCEKGNLLSSQKMVDYFLLIKSPVIVELASPFTNKLRKISNITAVFDVNMQQQKDMENILESIEMHELEFVK